MQCYAICSVICHKLEFYWNWWVDWAVFFGTETAPGCILKGNLFISKNKGISIWKLFSNSELGQYSFLFFFSARCNIYISRLCYDVSVRLSVTEVHCGHRVQWIPDTFACLDRWISLLLTDNASPGSSDGMMPGFLVEEGGYGKNDNCSDITYFTYWESGPEIGDGFVCIWTMFTFLL